MYLDNAFAPVGTPQSSTGHQQLASTHHQSPQIITPQAALPWYLRVLRPIESDIAASFDKEVIWRAY